MSISSSKARKIAKRLLKENRENGRSWRTIAREDYDNQVNFATLNRFALSEGEWIPKNKEILVALGLSKPRKKFPRPAWLLRWYRLSKTNAGKLSKII